MDKLYRFSLVTIVYCCCKMYLLAYLSFIEYFSDFLVVLFYSYLLYALFYSYLLIFIYL